MVGPDPEFPKELNGDHPFFIGDLRVLIGVLRAGDLPCAHRAIPSRAAARLPHLTVHDVAEIDAEVRAVLTELGEGEAPETPL
jgi:hypothetical protein